MDFAKDQMYIYITSVLICFNRLSEFVLHVRKLHLDQTWSKCESNVYLYSRRRMYQYT